MISNSCRDIGGERNVTALARHRDPVSAGPDEARDADPGAGAEHHLGGLRCRRAAADLMQLLSAQMRQRQSERLKVVEEKDVVEVRGAGQAFGGEGPDGIGELDLVACERRRHGNGASAWTLFQAVEIDLGGSFDACMLGAGKLPDLGQLEGFEIGESEAGVGAADIGDEGAGARVCGFPIIGGW